MSEAARLVLTWLGYFMIAMLAVFAIGASSLTLMGGRQGMAKVKRLSVKLGQRLEVEYELLPATKEIPADVEISRVLAYQGAVAVDVLPLLRLCAEDTVKSLTDRCAEAEILRA